MAKLIFGCGYLGSRVAQIWLSGGHEVHALTRSGNRAPYLRRRGINPIIGNVAEPGTLADLPEADTVLYSVGFDPRGGYTRQAVQVDGVHSMLSALPKSVERIIFISTTGVYGQRGGVKINEDSPTEPVSEGGRAALEAEQAVRQHPWGAKTVILRLAGLYGPGRIPRRSGLVLGEPVVADATSFLNLIHIDDAARIVLAAESHAKLPRTYLVSDGNPVRRGEFYRELARLAGAEPPKFKRPPEGQPQSDRGATDKRVSNVRMLRELGVQLVHPTFREGLASSVAVEVADE